MNFYNSNLRLNEHGQYIDDGVVILPEQLKEYLSKKIFLPKDCTDIFVFVHGWRESEASGTKLSQDFFEKIVTTQRDFGQNYGRIGHFLPFFLTITWPSQGNYFKIRKRTRQVTELGEAEFFLAFLLDTIGEMRSSKLQSASGAWIHCLGHSFGGRFLSHAITASHDPSPSTIGLIRQYLQNSKLSGIAETPFEFNVDSFIVFQMAASRSRFQRILTRLIDGRSPLRGPIVLTHARKDSALGFYHRLAELSPGIGFAGATQPSKHISNIEMKPLEDQYVDSDFGTRIVNVDANRVFRKSAGFLRGGVHSDIVYSESAHLILSVANFVRQNS